MLPLITPWMPYLFVNVSTIGRVRPLRSCAVSSVKLKGRRTGTGPARTVADTNSASSTNVPLTAAYDSSHEHIVVFPRWQGRVLFVFTGALNGPRKSGVIANSKVIAL